MGTIYQDGTYAANNPTMGTEGSAQKAREVAAALQTQGIHPSSICEVGCGAGAILASLATLYPDAKLTGFDIQPEAIERAQQEQTDRLRFELRDVADVSERFDVLLGLDVVEHVDDLYGFLRTIRKLADAFVFRIPLDISAQAALRTGGWQRARFKLGHVHSFNRQTALWSLEQTGYTILDWTYLPPKHHSSEEPFRQRVAQYPRRAAYRVAPELTVRTLGGFSLQVVATG